MHILDLIMYFVCCFLLWGILHIISNGELTQEMGALAGFFIIFVFTIIYIIMFWFCDYNWIDIFHNIQNGTIKWYFNLRL